MKKKWLENYSVLLDYKKNNNNLLPKNDEMYKGVNIGDWFAYQKVTYKKGEKREDGTIFYNGHLLEKEEVELLEKAGINISLYEQNQRVKFNRNIEILKKYLSIYNRFPDISEEMDDIRIGLWVNKNRRTLKKGEIQEDGSITYKGNIIYKDQKERLEEIGFDTISEVWLLKYNLLKEYISIHNTLPKIGEKYKGVPLSNWVERMVSVLKNGDRKEDGSIIYDGSVLYKKQIELLKLINIEESFLFKRDEKFNTNYSLLKEYYEKNKKMPSYNTLYKRHRLGKWLFDIKLLVRNGEEIENGSIRYNSRVVTKEQLDLLNSLNFNWVNYNNKFKKDVITSSEDYNMKKRVLLLNLKKQLLKEKQSLESYEDIKRINNNFLKSLK